MGILFRTARLAVEGALLNSVSPSREISIVCGQSSPHLRTRGQKHKRACSVDVHSLIPMSKGRASILEKLHQHTNVRKTARTSITAAHMLPSRQIDTQKILGAVRSKPLSLCRPGRAVDGRRLGGFALECDEFEHYRVRRSLRICSHTRKSTLETD